MAANELLKIKLPANASRLKTFRDAVKQVLDNLKCDETVQRDIALAVDEACCNIIRHAYGKDGRGDIEMEILLDGQMLVVRLRDFAQPIDKSRLKPRSLNDVRPGGLGLHFMHQVMDEVTFMNHPNGKGNIVEMRKSLDAKP